MILVNAALIYRVIRWFFYGDIGRLTSRTVKHRLAANSQERKRATRARLLFNSPGRHSSGNAVGWTAPALVRELRRQRNAAIALKNMEIPA